MTATREPTNDPDDPDVFTPEQVEGLHRRQFGPFAAAYDDHVRFGTPMRMHPYTCPNRGDGRHFDNGSDLGALIPTVRGWICQCCDYRQGWAHDPASLRTAGSA